jgi:hypothetical protein
MNGLLKLNDQLWGAPSGVLVILFAIMLGYLLKTLPFVNNRYIPLTVVVFCTTAFMIIAPAHSPDMAERIYIGRNFIIGAILGFTAWTFHAQILRRWIDPKFFNDDGSTKFITKPPAG